MSDPCLHGRETRYCQDCEIARLRNALAVAERERDEFAAHVERLRALLADTTASLGVGEFGGRIRAALASTPAASLAAHGARVRAEALEAASAVPSPGELGLPPESTDPMEYRLRLAAWLRARARGEAA